MKSARVLKNVNLYTNMNIQNNYSTSPVETNVDHHVEKRVAEMSPSGFIACLVDSYTSDGSKKVNMSHYVRWKYLYQIIAISVYNSQMGFRYFSG